MEAQAGFTNFFCLAQDAASFFTNFNPLPALFWNIDSISKALWSSTGSQSRLESSRLNAYGTPYGTPYGAKAHRTGLGPGCRVDLGVDGVIFKNWKGGKCFLKREAKNFSMPRVSLMGSKQQQFSLHKPLSIADVDFTVWFNNSGTQPNFFTFTMIFKTGSRFFRIRM